MEMGLNSLSDELCTEINRHLDVYDLASLSATCRKHYNIIRDADFMNRLHSVPVKSARGIDRRVGLISSLPRSERKTAFLKLAGDIPKTIEASVALRRHVDHWLASDHRDKNAGPERNGSWQPFEKTAPDLDSLKRRHRRTQAGAMLFVLCNGDSPSAQASLRERQADFEINFIKEDLEHVDQSPAKATIGPATSRSG